MWSVVIGSKWDAGWGSPCQCKGILDANQVFSNPFGGGGGGGFSSQNQESTQSQSSEGQYLGGCR